MRKKAQKMEAQKSIFQKLKESHPDLCAIRYDGELDLEFCSGERMNKREFLKGTSTRKLMDTLEKVLDK
jgi:hypothetical protein